MSPTSAPPSGTVVEQFLRASKLAPALADGLHGAHARAVAKLAASPAGWHSPSDIKTLDGLGGSYLWLENPLLPARISFRFDPGHVGSDGTYEIINGLSTLKHGPFHSVPNNPAIGWAGITLVPVNDPSRLRSFIVAGMLTDAEWKIEMLLLNKLDAKGPVQPPFCATRIL